MFSLRMLFAVVAIAAVYIAGIFDRSQFWEPVALTLTYVIYAAALTAAIVAREKRVFFVAFVVFGLAYGLCVWLELLLLPQATLNALAGWIGPQRWSLGLIHAGRSRWGDSDLAAFMAIGHSFYAVWISFLAGGLAETIVRRRAANGQSTGA